MATRGNEEEANVGLRFTPFTSFVDPEFWKVVSTLKLDTDKVDIVSRDVVGWFHPGHDEQTPCRMEIPRSGLDVEQPPPNGYCAAYGSIVNVNTVEQFRNFDKVTLLENAAKQLLDSMVDKSVLYDPRKLSSFAVLCFADLKKYHYLHWFCFPAFKSSWKIITGQTYLKQEENRLLNIEVAAWKAIQHQNRQGIFAVVMSPVRIEIFPFDFLTSSTWQDTPYQHKYLAFVDPSNEPNAVGWTARNLLYFAATVLKITQLQLLCYRGTSGQSFHVEVALSHLPPTAESSLPPHVGWERNNNKLVPKLTDLSSIYDPVQLAVTSVNLNLKLMKWRVAPDLNLEAIQTSKCLLIGAGTLGCYVGRLLAAWGVSHITFVDNGTVSFSNPVRQPLFTFTDCLNGGRPKAEQAAKALKEIQPAIKTFGHKIDVPMPDHPITSPDKAHDDFLALENLVKESDAIFLLTDSRESRWLPTVMATAERKFIINAALGFDSYVVMRHGGGCLENNSLGCYFCNDIIAPSDSLMNRTVDQMCTVTRPGVAAIAAASAVELFASVTQHPLGREAPTSTDPDSDLVLAEEAMNVVQHVHVRFTMLICHRSGDFVTNACNKRHYIEEISGLAEVQRRAEEAAANIEKWEEEEEEDDYIDSFV